MEMPCTELGWFQNNINPTVLSIVTKRIWAGFGLQYNSFYGNINERHFYRTVYIENECSALYTHINNPRTGDGWCVYSVQLPVFIIFVYVAEQEVRNMIAYDILMKCSNYALCVKLYVECRESIFTSPKAIMFV